jgi:putative ABC transport system permease protein
MSAWLSSWRLALRLARRDLLKHRSRAAIALVMVTLPVLAVVAADVLIQTSDVSAAEGIDRRLGTVATAQVKIVDGRYAVAQGPDPAQQQGTGDRLSAPPTVADIESVIGRRSMLRARLDDGELVVRTKHGRESVAAREVDGSAPLAHGLLRLSAGRWPTGPGEVAVNRAMHDRGVGDELSAISADGTESALRVVGTVVDATARAWPVVVGLPGTLPLMDYGQPPSRAWLVDGPALTWDQVERLNAIGVAVTDRHIVTHPDAYPDPMGDAGSGMGDQTLQIVALVVVMALIEVVLLAGPAFAVGARKQQRSLALLLSSGGTPAQARRVILAGGLLLGLLAAVVGVVGGIAAGWALQPLVQRFDDGWLGPFEVVPLHVLGVAVFGLASALIACLVPAWIASRQNVVAVLAGRRGDAEPGRAFPVLGVVLFAAGVLMAVAGARGEGSLTVAWSAVVCVLGMVLLVPVVVTAVAAAAGPLPLPVRFAARDAVRHRIRTTSAVAAVAATVAGAVALGISTASDAEENRETYGPQLRMGDAAITPVYDFLPAEEVPPVDWPRVEQVVRQQVPAARLAPVVGVQQQGPPGSSQDVTLTDPADGETWIVPDGGSGGLGTSVLISDGSDLPALVTEAFPGAAAELAAGRAVVFGGREGPRPDRVRIQVTRSAPETDDGQQVTADLTVPARVVVPAPLQPVVNAVLPPAMAQRAGLTPTTVGLLLSRPHLSEQAEKDLRAALQDLATPAGIYVERGYQADPDVLIIRWVLVVLAALLMLGGTLTAMFLSLSDARADLATLAAVGAAPRTRRGVAAAYTFVLAFVGSVLGMLVGFVPGLAITWPLTTGNHLGTGPYVDIPWLMIGVIVVGLPVLTALVVAGCTRSRLPMVTRLG